MAALSSAAPVDRNTTSPEVSAKDSVNYDGPVEVFGRVQGLQGNTIVIAHRNEHPGGAPEFFEANDREEGRFTEPVDVLVRVPERSMLGTPTGRTVWDTERVYMQPRVAVAAGAKKGIPSPDTYSLQGVTTTPSETDQDLPVIVDVIPPLTELGGGIVPSSPFFSRSEERQGPSEVELANNRHQLDLLAGEVGVGSPGSITARDGQTHRWIPATVTVRRGDQVMGSIRVLKLDNPKETPVKGPRVESLVDFRLNIEGDGETTVRTTQQNLDLLHGYYASATAETLGQPREVTVREGW